MRKYGHVTFEEVLEAVKEAGLAPVELELPKHAQGSTGYIDGVRIEDLNSALSQGVDEYGRRFLAVAIDHNNVTVVETIFERYTDSAILTSGGESILITSSMDDNDLDYFKRILARETVGKRTWEYDRKYIGPDDTLIREEEGAFLCERGIIALASLECSQ